jgi:hypothetical protein
MFSVMMFSLLFIPPKKEDSGAENVFLKLSAAIILLMQLISILGVGVARAPIVVRNMLQQFYGSQSQPNPNEDVVANDFVNKFLAGLDLNNSINAQSNLEDHKQAIVEALKDMLSTPQRTQQFFENLKALISSPFASACSDTSPYILANVRFLMDCLQVAFLQLSESNRDLAIKNLKFLLGNALHDTGASSTIEQGQTQDTAPAAQNPELRQRAIQSSTTGDSKLKAIAVVDQGRADALRQYFPPTTSSNAQPAWGPDIFRQQLRNILQQCSVMQSTGNSIAAERVDLPGQQSSTVSGNP